MNSNKYAMNQSIWLWHQAQAAQLTTSTWMVKFNAELQAAHY